jgi:hypothetical protein
MTIEEKAKLAWQIWGHNWCMNTVCHGCGEYKVCRGKTKRKMLCLSCWDQGAR